jgi:hypothetical protein
MKFRTKKYMCAIVTLGLFGIAQSYAAPTAVVAISGTIRTPSSQGISGVTITFSNGGPSVVSDANGNYTASVVSGYNGTATPSLAGYTFSPTSRQYGNLGADVPGSDYTGTLAPDFTISVTPASQAVTAGNSVNYTVTITPSQGFNSPVNLSCTTVPIGVSCNFSPNPATNTSTLTVSTTANASSGGITVTGTSGPLTHTGSSANLTVNPAPIDDPTLLLFLWFFSA